MKNKIYTSYAQIDRDLRIYELQKEISYQKIVFTLHQISISLRPTSLISNLFSPTISFFTGQYGQVLIKTIPILLNWFLNRKKGI